MNQILNYILNILPFLLIALPIIIIIRVAINKKLNDNNVKSNKYREIAMVIFFLFLVGLTSQTILPKLQFDETGIHMIKVARDINIIPFKFITTAYNEILAGNFTFLIINILGNIAVFIPIGFFLPLLFKKMRTIKNIFLISFFSSLSIEVIQLFVNRITDIDDIIFNVLGALIGYWIFKVVKKHNIRFIKKFKLRYYLRDRKNASNRINFN